MLKTLEKKCGNCGQEIEQLDDDAPKKNFCKSCESPNCNPVQRRAFFKKNGGVPQPEDTTIPLPIQLQLTFGKLDFKYFLDDEKRFKPAICAKIINQTADFKYDRATEIFYYYDTINNVWKPNAEVIVKEILGIALFEENNKHIYNDVVYCLQSLCMEDVAFSTSKIAVENGILNPCTRELSPFSSKEMVRHHIQAKYDPEAECDAWEEFLNQCLPNEDVLLLQEWSGFLLLPNYTFHKILWMYGKGRNGKGVWCRTMEDILGQENCSSIGLEEFNGGRRFATANLYGSLFNPCCEPLSKKELQTPLLKKITGQDTLNAEIKGKQKRLKFKNYAKITPIGNEFPKVKDRTTAFRQRTNFILWPNEFTGNNQVQDLETAWLENNKYRSAILNWMLEGLQRLLSNGKFTESKTQKQIEIEFLRASDSINAFLNEMTKKAVVTVYTSRTETYNAYKDYCETYGIEIESPQEFTKTLRSTKGIRRGWGIVNAKRCRVWQGLELLKDDESEHKESKLEYFDKRTLAEDDTTTDTTETIGVIPCEYENPNIKGVQKGVKSVVSVADQNSLIKCYFCGKAVPEKGWIKGELSEHKPAHTSCFSVRESQQIGEDSVFGIVDLKNEQIRKFGS